MRQNRRAWIELTLAVLPVALALAFSLVILLLVGASPLAAYEALIRGAFGSPETVSKVVLAWVPLLFCAAGLMLTFTAGQWNIGVEGQIILGAIFATAVARAWPQGSPWVVIPLLLLAGIAGGALWGLLAGALKTYGGIHEIFAGLGLNFVASGLTLYLIFGPWKQPGIATMSGTELFHRSVWLPTLGTLSLSPLSLALALITTALVFVVLRGTLFGLKLKAMGKNLRSAFFLGIPTQRFMLMTFGLCGGIAGLAGAVQVAGVWHRLIPAISSGYGYLAILVVLLSGYRTLWIMPIALFFAALNVGGTQLQLDLNLDSSMTGVIQGTLVLSVLLIKGIREQYLDGRK